MVRVPVDNTKLAVSLSVVVTVTVLSATWSYPWSLLFWSTETVITVSIGPSIILSFWPVTVTSPWVVSFQLAVVNVIDAGETVTSSVSADVNVRTTSPRGCLSNTTINLSVVPLSDTEVPPSVSVIVNPASLSWLVTVTSLLPAASNASWLDASTDTVTILLIWPSAIASSTPFTVTGWAEFQLSVVNVNIWSPLPSAAGLNIITSPGSADEIFNTTSPAGCLFNWAVNWAVVSASDTVRVVVDKLISGVSLSVTFTPIVLLETPS